MPRLTQKRVRELMAAAAAGGGVSPQAAVDPLARNQTTARGEGCRWCGGAPLPPRRRSFCGDACVHEHLLRSCNQYRRTAVYLRDGPACAGCGVDTGAIGATLRRSPARARQAYGLSAARVSRPRRCGGAVFDVDHVLPVHAGGGGCGLDNLRLLCPACHAAVTWACPRKPGAPPAPPAGGCHP